MSQLLIRKYPVNPHVGIVVIATIKQDKIIFLIFSLFILTL
ncbi:hypothetical protein AP20H10_01890 [Apilactobacillus apinorum]|uniref:Uncharacterized protein n=1 Tax=Apilactobacillus apinorum TaxID=1218495 RepID=A0ABP9ZG98_9LACO